MIIVHALITIYFAGYQRLDEQLVPSLYILSIVPFILLFNCFRKRGEIEFKDIGFTRTKWKYNLLFGLITGIFLGMVALAFALTGYIQIGTIPRGDKLYFFFDYFFPRCISAPLWEEIAFRGLLLNAIEKLFNASERLSEIFNKTKMMEYTKHILIII